MTGKEKDLVLTRVFDAPRERVWKAWTDPRQVAQWWGPAGFTNPRCEVDVRPGGVLRIDMRGPDGTVYPMAGVYREVVAPERLVFIVSFSDPKGGVTRHPGHANWPLETLSTVTFAEQGGKTRVSVQWIPADSATEMERKTFDEGRDGMKQGWGGTMDQFGAYLGQAK